MRTSRRGRRTTGRGRAWLPEGPQQRESEIREAIAGLTGAETVELIETLIERNRRDPRGRVHQPQPGDQRDEPASRGGACRRGSARGPRSATPGEKYEMGLEAIEEIEVIAADLACRVFDARLRRDPRRLGCARQPVRVHGHVPARRLDHRAAGDRSAATSRTIAAGAAGLYGLDIHECPIDAAAFHDRSRRSR